VNTSFAPVALLILACLASGYSSPGSRPSTTVSIKGGDFFINDEITLKGRTLDGSSLEGLLPNARMVQGIFDDLNPETRRLWKYPETGEWNPDRNTDEFIAAMPGWRRHGLLAFTLNMQGGSPTGYGNKGWINPGYNKDGTIRNDYAGRLGKILSRADELGMVVILGLFYFGQDQQLESEAAVTAADDPAVLDNAHVRVMHDAAACPAAHTPGFGTRVVVALAEMTVHSSRGSTNLKRGEVAVFLVHESYTAPTGVFFEVALKHNHPPVKGPEEWIEPSKIALVYEDEQFRVFEERLAPGDTRELHSHAQRIVVRLNEVQLTDPRYHPNGTPGGGIQVPNTVRFAEPVVHVVRNLSAIPLFNIVIEFKVTR
jgi:hypothetical protein